MAATTYYGKVGGVQQSQFGQKRSVGHPQVQTFVEPLRSESCSDKRMAANLEVECVLTKIAILIPSKEQSSQ